MIKKAFNISREDVRATIRIFSGMNKKECLNYWSQATKIPKDKFIILLNDRGTRGRTKYGMCRISVKKGGNTLKLIRSIIDQFSTEVISSHN